MLLHNKICYVITIFRCIDTNDEERDKGKTVEYGKAFFETEKKVSQKDLRNSYVTLSFSISQFWMLQVTSHLFHL